MYFSIISPKTYSQEVFFRNDVFVFVAVQRFLINVADKTFFPTVYDMSVERREENQLDATECF